MHNDSVNINIYYTRLAKDLPDESRNRRVIPPVKSPSKYENQVVVYHVTPEKMTG